MRKTISSLLFFLVISTGTHAQPFVPRIKPVYWQLGDDFIVIRTYQYGNNKNLFFINVHDNETTAVSSAKKILAKYGGTLVRIENAKERYMRFRFKGRQYAFDPNRIFSHDGIDQTLKTYNLTYDPGAADELKKFGERIIKLLPPTPTTVIALHNNADGEFSILSYMTGREREREARAIYVKSVQDPDDLFVTTDSLFYMYMTNQKFNIVLQDSNNDFDDGSLSVYCGDHNIPYINCETQHGRLRQYGDMLTLTARYIKGRVSMPSIFSYRYLLSPNPDSVGLAKACDIWFGEKKVGSVLLKNNSIGKGFSGQLLMEKSFPLYDNMDLYYYPATANRTAKIDLRVDPTRPKKLYDPVSAVIPIKVMH